MSKGLVVKDQLKGIHLILKVMSTKDVSIFYIDVNTVLKHEKPCWIGDDLLWTEPGWSEKSLKEKRRTKIKTCTVNFGSRFKNFNVVMMMARYSCFIVFYRKEFLERATTSEPVYVEPDKKGKR